MQFAYIKWANQRNLPKWPNYCNFPIKWTNQCNLPIKWANHYNLPIK